MNKKIITIFTIIIIFLAIGSIFLITKNKIALENPDTYQNCIFNNDCKLVESTRACRKVEGINKKISDQVWQNFLENKVPQTYDKCPRAELNLDNAKAKCKLGKCLAIKK